MLAIIQIITQTAFFIRKKNLTNFFWVEVKGDHIINIIVSIFYDFKIENVFASIGNWTHSCKK